MIEERMMAAGVFSVPLIERTPMSARNAVTPGGYIVVTAGLLDIESPSAILDRSIYTGMLRSTGGDGRELSGAHANVLLGDEDGKGDVERPSKEIIESDTRAACIDELLTHANGLTRGYVWDDTTSTTIGARFGETPRKWLAAARNPAIQGGFGGGLDIAYAAGRDGGVGLDWRVNPDLTFDIGKDEMWADQDVIIGAVPTCYGSPRAIHATPEVVPVDITDWAGGALVIDGGSPESQAESAYSSPFYNAAGNVLQVWGFRRESEDLDSGISDAADEYADSLSSFRVSIEATTTYRYPRLQIAPGDYLGVYLPAIGVLDDTNPIEIAGETVRPTPRRCVMLRWPLVRPMGVYHITPTDPLTTIDLTRWVDWETDRPTELEVAAQTRSFDDLYARSTA